MIPVEKRIRDYLQGYLGVPVYCERPAQKPEEYIIVSRSGSSRKDKLNCAHIAIQSCSTSLYSTMTLNEFVKEALDADRIPDITCHLESDYNYTDTATKTYRYQCIYNVYY